MNPKKQKEKDRRRARKLATEAWEAANEGNLDLAEKIMRRAVVAQEDNPILWNDLGQLLGLRGKGTEAADSFRAAISLAPTYADPYDHLAKLLIRQGSVQEAVALQTQAVKHAPKNAAFHERMAAYLALAGREAATPVPRLPEARTEDETSPSVADWPTVLAALDWHALTTRLTRDGCAVIAGLVDAPTCERLRGMFEDDARFAKTVVMDRPEFGQGIYRYFAAPIPEVVDQLRRAVYPHVALIANDWQHLLNEPACLPADWEGFRDDCARSGQTTPTPILLKYEPGGFNALHRDLRGAVFFPIQLAVVLSPLADPADPQAGGFEGGEFLFCDVLEGGKARRQEVRLGLGANGRIRSFFTCLIESPLDNQWRPS